MYMEFAIDEIYSNATKKILTGLYRDMRDGDEKNPVGSRWIWRKEDMVSRDRHEKILYSFNSIKRTKALCSY